MPVADSAPGPADRLTAAAGNASLLGIGYLWLGRWGWAVVTTPLTITLVVLLGTGAPRLWLEALFLVWWAALIAHGWYLAGRTPVPGRRALALLVSVAVLVGIGYVRLDAAGIDDSITEARETGDCGTARSARDRIWFGHRVVDGSMVGRGERTSQACDRLWEARTSLQQADPAGLTSGYRELGAVLAELPGHDRMVGSVLDGFLGSLPGREPCELVVLTDWLRKRPASNNLLDRTAAVAPKVAPAALIGCADESAERNDWDNALPRYRQLLSQYPGHQLAARAKQGVQRATEGLQLQHLFALGDGYCEKPAVYSAAVPHRKGAMNRAIVYHPDEYGDMYLDKLPEEWQADGSEAAIVVCIGERAAGAPIRTCPYRSEADGKIRNVTFSKMAFPVRTYELRTGRLLLNTKVEIGGSTCPATLTGFGPGDQLRMLATPSESALRAAFARVFRS